MGALFSVPLDAHDIFPHAVAKEQKAYVVESYPGGIGIAKKLSAEVAVGSEELAWNIAAACTCGAGCPNCIVPPRSTDHMDKVEAVEFAKALLDATGDEASGVFRGGLWVPVGAA